MYQKITLAPGIAQEFTESGDFFRILQATPSDIEVIFSTINGQELVHAQNLGAGYSERFSGAQFGKVRLASAAGGDVAFVTRLGNEVRYDAPPTGAVTISGTPNVNVQNFPAKQGPYSRNQLIGVDNGTPQVLFPANPNRRYVMVQCIGGQNVRLRVDGTDATPGGGIRIGVGGYWESPPGFAPTGKISIIAEVAGGSNIEGIEG